ncbi:phage tail protein [Solitalea longa]|uniref:Phage tail protein n=1 Tax=Solitalea longa TaxID=2079460 RepID=A0A2S4ZWF9_9SPHI|nr:tail fiber protein [Solitalea longa]POY34645.1 phage tail protein [Solitalea longa]
MDEELMGVIKIFAGNFAPRGYALCQGQLLSIAQNQALFAILGTTYGGNGQTTFALPDLRGRAPIGVGQGPGLSNYGIGQVSGAETVTLMLNNLPAHNHPITGSVQLPVNDSNADVDSPIGAYLGTPATSIYSGTTNAVAANLNTNLATGVVGNNYPVSIMQPYLAVNYIIVMSGIFPSRN